MPMMKINGCGINFEDTQSGKDAILLLGGTAGTIGLWRKFQIPHFRRRFRVVAMDYRGTGGSERDPARYSLELFAQDGIALLQELGIEHAHIVAHSMGASVAEAAAKLGAGLVNKVVLCSPGGHLNPKSITTRGIPIKLVLQLVERGYLQRMRDHYTGHFWWLDEYRAAHPDRVQELAETLIAELPTLEFYLKHVQARQEFDALSYLEALTIPTLIVVGSGENILDGTMPHLDAARRIHELVRGSRLFEVPGAAHGYLWQEPTSVNQVIEDFLLA